MLEIGKVENFIEDFLQELSIHLGDPQDSVNLQQWHLTPRLYDLH